MTPKVTVLLAVHNGDPFLGRCVDSVLAQTYEDFEFLVVDDASVDGTTALLEAVEDERVRVIRNERNRGLVPSLNLGLQRARGDYVARVDADDWCLPARLEREVAVLDERPRVGLVGTWMTIVDERERRVARLRSTIADFPEFVFHNLIMRVLVSHPSAMFRREPVLALGAYDESTWPAEEKDLWRRLALARWDAHIVPEPLVVYRLHAGQISQQHAALQREVDGRSQEHFLAELSPDCPARSLRRLLTADDELWEDGDPHTTLASLDHLLADARSRLRLDAREEQRLRRLVAERVLEVAAARPWHRIARVLVRYGAARVDAADRRRALARHAGALAISPAARGTRRALRLVAASSALAGLRARARRSRLARLVYGRVAGGA